MSDEKRKSETKLVLAIWRKSLPSSLNLFTYFEQWFYVCGVFFKEFGTMKHLV